MRSVTPTSWNNGRAGPIGTCLLLIVLALAMPLVASADSLDDGVRNIARQLRCPICESVSVADSPADLAGQMRAVIRKKLETGESEQQILDYFVAAYGDAVLLEPPRRGLGWAVWLGPLIALGVGLVILWLLLRGLVRQGNVARHASGLTKNDRLDPLSSAAEGGDEHLGSDSEGPDGEVFAARARQELDALREGMAR